MISRNKRGNRQASVRVRLAVAAAVLVGGGAAGVVAVAASQGSAVSAQSAGYYTHRHHDHSLSETHAMSTAMDWWAKSPRTSLSLISRMRPMRTFSTTPFHRHMLALQRGTVLGEAKDAFVIKSVNRQFELWHVNRGTKFLNVGGTQAGMRAMTGGTMSIASGTQMNLGATTLAKGDLVFIFGERVHGRLMAQLVLFAAPLRSTATMPATTMPATTTRPTAATTSPAMSTVTPSAAATNTAPSFTGSHS